ncbi:MAG: hypothetical protein LC775_01935, partial [Acidobacteria bacterium]|nr:hypothetical protein [Acidobacteriota bacterium]
DISRSIDHRVCGFGYSGPGNHEIAWLRRRSMGNGRRVGQVGMGMVPRGEVGIVVAQIGLGMAVISDSLYGVILIMGVVTTLIAPPFLRILYGSETERVNNYETTGRSNLV